MNILIIAPTPYFSDRGCHIRILSEIEALKKAGHNPVLYTYHLGRNMGNVPTYRSLHIPWYKKTSAGPSWQKIYLDLFLLFKILFTYRKHNFDIIHGHLHEGAWIGYWVKLFLKKPLILDAQGSLVEELERYNFFKQSKILKKFFTRLERKILLRADHVFTSSPALLTKFYRDFPDLKDKFSVLPDAVTQTVFEFTRNTSTELAALLNIDLTKPVVIYTGSLLPAKGIDYLLEAIPQVLKTHPSTQFVVIGYPLEYIRTQLQKMHIEKKVRLVGKVDYTTVFQYLALADIAVDPKPSTTSESSGKLLNYMAAGLAVVTFANTNTQSVLNGTGLLVPDETSTGLAQGIITLLDDVALTEHFGKTAQARVREHYAWEQIIQHAIRTYDELQS